MRGPVLSHQAGRGLHSSVLVDVWIRQELTENYPLTGKVVKTGEFLIKLNHCATVTIAKYKIVPANKFVCFVLSLHCYVLPRSRRGVSETNSTLYYNILQHTMLVPLTYTYVLIECQDSNMNMVLKRCARLRDSLPKSSSLSLINEGVMSRGP